MSWFRTREGQEGEKKEVHPEKIKDPDRPTIEAKDKLNPSERDRHDAFVEKLRVNPENARKNEGERGKIKPTSGATSEGDPTRGQRQRELGHVTERE